MPFPPRARRQAVASAQASSSPVTTDHRLLPFILPGDRGPGVLAVGGTAPSRAQEHCGAELCGETSTTAAYPEKNSHKTASWAAAAAHRRSGSPVRATPAGSRLPKPPTRPGRLAWIPSRSAAAATAAACPTVIAIITGQPRRARRARRATARGHRYTRLPARPAGLTGHSTTACTPGTGAPPAHPPPSPATGRMGPPGRHGELRSAGTTAGPGRYLPLDLLRKQADELAGRAGDLAQLRDQTQQRIAAATAALTAAAAARQDTATARDRPAAQVTTPARPPQPAETAGLDGITTSYQQAHDLLRTVPCDLTAAAATVTRHKETILAQSEPDRPGSDPVPGITRR